MIGVIGGTGDIGSEVVELLLRRTAQEVKVGSRNIYRIDTHLMDSKRITVQHVDCYDSESLRRFMENCEIVINCVGPSHLITPHFLEEAERMGVHCVDLGTIKNARYRTAVNTVSIHSAGMAQGLSGILQRIAVEGIEEVEHFEYSFGGISSYTHSAASDFLDGINDGSNKPMSVYNKGEIVSTGILQLQHDHFYDRTVCFYPFFDEESDYIVKNSNIINGSWCFAVEGTYFNQILKKARYEAAADKESTVVKICNASKLDAEIYGPAIKFLVSSRWKKNRSGQGRTLSLMTRRQNYLSALVVMQVVDGILKNKVVKGRYPLVAINDPVMIYEGVCKDENIVADINNPIEMEEEYGVI
ncbi:SDR family oxidoreductase [Clostridium aminobutyricum]|uniref:Saccharopine dehydrogenase NADP-binding domain-containing protein n=1 Tax=Clostridium aminobutyricum TaxID=33953 RepID=A0A939D9K8_CLOAM|nr:saccharopine dehydrogenase NADP-binding domain-containing protein [Clostridium aminobutyricum]MBN7773929.1 saccharopine dehydrogenase NADP-binding domain-containing protein [Clostridium aminobutyricum]